MRIDPELHQTKTMMDKTCKPFDLSSRHVMARYELHNFHFRLCRMQEFHKLNEYCTV